jgi:hypothetical protein
MGRSAAHKLIAGAVEEIDLEDEPLEFLSNLIRRGSVAPPKQ